MADPQKSTVVQSGAVPGGDVQVKSKDVDQVSGLEACLAAFFTPEQVTWECPAEKELRSSQPEGGFETPTELVQMTTRNVSFSGTAVSGPCI